MRVVLRQRRAAAQVEIQRKAAQHAGEEYQASRQQLADYKLWASAVPATGGRHDPRLTAGPDVSPTPSPSKVRAQKGGYGME